LYNQNLIGSERVGLHSDWRSDAVSAIFSTGRRSVDDQNATLLELGILLERLAKVQFEIGEHL
jgi:hypothetical protein